MADNRKRSRRRKKKKSMASAVITLVVFVLILAVLVIINKTVLGNKSEDSDKNAKAQTESVSESVSEEASEESSEIVAPEGSAVGTIEQEEPEPEPITITISAAGDCTLGTDVNFDQSTSFNAKYNSVGWPAYFFEGVFDIFSKDDLTIVNLEGTFTESNSRADKTYAFKGKPEYTQILVDGSIEAVNTANNHSRDYGSESLTDTINYCEAAGITTFGGNSSKVIDVNGVKVGLVGTYELPYGIDCKGSMLEQIQWVKDNGAQLIICSFHWGTERENYPDSIQKSLAHAAIDAGADLVLGHHPHVLQGIEVYNGKYICYSLGNFCFGGNKNPTDKDTMIFQQTFTITGDEVEINDNVNIIPCSLSSHSGYNDYRPRVLTGDEGQAVLDRITKYSQGL